MNELNCIKCSEPYKTNDPDPYYCEKCDEERLEIAKEVDKKMANRKPSRPVKSQLQQYDEICKKNKTPFANIKDLGIKL